MCRAWIHADVAGNAGQAFQKQAGFLAERLAGPAQYRAFIFDLFVMIFAMFYFFRDAGQIVRGVRIFYL